VHRDGFCSACAPKDEELLKEGEGLEEFGERPGNLNDD